MKIDDALRALWCATMAHGGTLHIGPSVVEDYPGDENVWLTFRKDKTFGDLVVTAHQKDDAQSAE